MISFHTQSPLARPLFPARGVTRKGTLRNRVLSTRSPFAPSLAGCSKSLAPGGDWRVGAGWWPSQAVTVIRVSDYGTGAYSVTFTPSELLQDVAHSTLLRAEGPCHRPLSPRAPVPTQGRLPLHWAAPTVPSSLTKDTGDDLSVSFCIKIRCHFEIWRSRSN